MAGRALASFVPELRSADEAFRLRLLLHEFGLVWACSEAGDQEQLIAEEPLSTGSERWDAFLAAYAEHLAYHVGIDAPPWVHRPHRYLTQFWFPGGTALATLRVEALVHAPAAFEAHGVLLADRELEVV